MPKSTSDSIRALCRSRIAARRAVNDCPAQIEDWTVRLVEVNLASGRFERLAASRPKRQPLTLAEYVDRVVSYASQEYVRIHALEKSDPTEWNRLRDFLLRRAVPMVRRFRRETDASAAALDFAQQTCLIIFDERYPCDVSFDAWVTTILKNLVVAHYTRSPDILNRPHSPQSLDEPKSANGEDDTPLSDLIASADSLAPFEKIENQMVLLEAIKRLRSPAQSEVIRWSFLEELDDVQIARRLGKSTQAVYNLRQRALLRLRKILAESPRKKAAKKSIYRVSDLAPRENTHT